MESNVKYTQDDMDNAIEKERAHYEKTIAALRSDKERINAKSSESNRSNDAVFHMQEQKSEQSSMEPKGTSMPQPDNNPAPYYAGSQAHLNPYQLAYHIRDIQDRAEDRTREEYLARVRKAERDRDLIAVLAATGHCHPKFPGSS